MALTNAGEGNVDPLLSSDWTCPPDAVAERTPIEVSVAAHMLEVAIRMTMRFQILLRLLSLPVRIVLIVPFGPK